MNVRLVHACLRGRERNRELLVACKARLPLILWAVRLIRSMQPLQWSPIFTTTVDSGGDYNKQNIKTRQISGDPID